MDLKLRYEHDQKAMNGYECVQKAMTEFQTVKMT